MPKLLFSYPAQRQNSQMKQESCAIAKMTARCILYKWIEWVVADIL